MAEKEPLDYVIGSMEFLGCKIDLSLRPLIPRPETEYWTEKAIQQIRSHCAFSSRFIPPAGGSPTRLGRKRSVRSLVRCLDIFAGSGCVGIALLKHVPNATVDFAEKDRKFLGQIKKNLALNKVSSDRYRLVQSDVFSYVKGRYDIIFANPPYLATTRKRYIQKSVLDWEPRQALLAGPDGLLYIKQFVQEAKKHLNPGGKIFMEFDSWQKPLIIKILRSYSFRHFEFFRDQYGKWRYVVVQYLAG